MDKKYKLYLSGLVVIGVVSILALLSLPRNCSVNEPYKSFLRKRVNTIDDNTTEHNPNCWNRVVSQISKEYQEYDAWIVITPSSNVKLLSSGIAYLFEGLTKCIVVIEQGSDVELATLVATKYNIPEVVVVVGNRMLRGSNTDIELGKIGKGGKIVLHSDMILRTTGMPSVVVKKVDVKNVEVVGVRAPTVLDKRFIYSLTKNSGRHIIIALEPYTVVLPEAQKEIEYVAYNGVYVVLTDGKITLESAIAKLHFLLSNVPEHDPKLINSLMELNMRGEIREG